jgi:peptidoglycan/LPS O-acetylase OafA/YrhL
VYLFHFPLVGLALTTLHFPRGSNLDFLLMVAFVVPCSLLLGYLSMRFVEQPARRWARSARRRPKHLAEAFQPVPVPMARLEAE